MSEEEDTIEITVKRPKIDKEYFEDVIRPRMNDSPTFQEFVRKVANDHVNIELDLMVDKGFPSFSNYIKQHNGFKSQGGEE